MPFQSTEKDTLSATPKPALPFQSTGITTVTIAARVPPQVADQLREIADSHATTVSRLVAHILGGALASDDTP